MCEYFCSYFDAIRYTLKEDGKKGLPNLFFLALTDMELSSPQPKLRKIRDQEDSFSICFESSTQNNNDNGDTSFSQCNGNMDSVDASECIKSNSKNYSQATRIKNVVQTENQTADDKEKLPKRKRHYVGEFCLMSMGNFCENPQLIFVNFKDKNQ